MKKNLLFLACMIFFVLNVKSQLSNPTVAAPTPTRLAADVISLFSNAYTDVPVNTWSAVWDNADFADTVVAGNDTKKYSNLIFSGIEFTTPTIDATTMTHYHVDVWATDASAIKVKLVDFGANGIYDGGGDDKNSIEYTLTPAPAIGTWVGFDIPLTSFTGLDTKAHLAQMLFVSTGTSVYVDNIYLYKTAVAPSGAPSTAAPTPTRLAADVISLFSNAYTDVPVNTWSAVWDNADFADTVVAGNDTKKYSNLIFSGIEFTTPTIDATTMTHYHVDVWATDASAIKVKLVDFGANGVYDGGGDDKNSIEYTLTPAPAIGTWVGFDIPLTSFTGLDTKAHLAQMLFVSTGTSIYVDNIYLYKTTTPSGSLIVAAPTPPVRNVSDVISVFSGAYNDVAGTDFFPNWGQTTVVSDTTVAGNLTKKYATLNYQGIQFSSPVDVSAMTTLHLDLWTPDCTSFDVFLINQGIGEQKVTVTPTLFGWNSYDIALSQYPAIALNNIGQFKLEGRPSGSKVYLDNIYFYKTVSSGGGLTVAAPTPPVRDASDVISVFSGAYTDLAGTDFNPNWGQTTAVTDTTIAGDLTKKYANFNYQGMQFANPIDASAMTKLHIDIWSANATGVKVFPIVSGQPEQQVTVTIAAGWNSFDIDLTQYTIPLSSIIQIKMESVPFGGTDIYFDNLYFYKTASGGGTGLTTAAPTPPVRNPADVISVFSGDYTDITGTDFFPNWGQTTVVSDTTVAGNITKKYASLNYQGIQFSSPVDVSAMNTLHLDLWTADCTSFDIFLINQGIGEQKVTVTPALLGWNSYDIALSEYTTIALNNIGQFKLEGRPSGSKVYLDNIYFYRGTTTPITLVNFDAVKKSDGTVAINWATSNEFNSDYFLIERSIDGLRFNQVAKLAAKNNATGASYSISDRFPVNGINYYRLVQVDRDGNKKIYPVRKVNIINKNGSISVYPNPLTGSVININIPGITDNRLNVKLINLQGKIIYSGIAIQQGDSAQIRLNNKPSAGVYLLKVGEQKSVKIIVN